MEKVSIIIPVFNEEKTLQQVLTKVKATKIKANKEIIVVNDASRDNSADILNNTKGIRVFHHQINKGKGAAIRTGLNQATGSIILIQDADLEYSPNEYPQILAPILDKKARVVYGSRIAALKRDTKDMYWMHYFGNRFLSFTTSILYGKQVTDMETCYKVFRRDVLKGMVLRCKRFDFEPEITAKILKKGYHIFEVPISFHARKFNEGKKITWKDGVKALFYLVKYRIMD